MSCLATLLAFLVMCAGIVLFGIGQLCELGLYLLGDLLASLGLL